MNKPTSQKISGSKVEAIPPPPKPTQMRRATSIGAIVSSDVDIRSTWCPDCGHVFSFPRHLRRHQEKAKYCRFIRMEKELRDLKAEMDELKAKGNIKQHPKKNKPEKIFKKKMA